MSATMSLRQKYALALALLLAVISALFIIDSVMRAIIIAYLPWLSPDLPYAVAISKALLGIAGAYLVYRILLSIVPLAGAQRYEQGNAEIIKVVLRILFYAAAISITLTSLGLSVSDALAGGAIGGIIVGLAVQTIVTSILSGFLLSTSKTVLPGDILVLQTAPWGSILCKVHKTNVLFTDVTSHDGNRIKLPNTALFGSTAVTRLNMGDKSTYAFPISIGADVRLKGFERSARAELASTFSRLKRKPPTFYLFSKTSSSNTYNVMLQFDDFENINALISAANNAFDAAYWAQKK